MSAHGPHAVNDDPQQTIRLLQEELAQTNHEVMVLTLELEKRVDERTAELRKAQQELEHTNSTVLKLAVELEHRVARRTDELEQANRSLRQEIAERRQGEIKLQAQLSRLDLLHRITRAIGERQDTHSICQVVIQTVEKDLPLDFGCIFRYDAGEDSITVTNLGTLSQLFAREMELVVGESIAAGRNGIARSVRGHLVYEPDISPLGAPFTARLAAAGLRAVVVAPLVVESKVFGILLAARRQEASFSSGECEFLRQLSEHVALAAHQSQLYQTLQQAYEDLRRTQDAVMQQERLRALGQMASGIAHDINNSISPIALYTESLLEWEPNLSDRARDYLGVIQRAIEDVAQTVSRMREFYRQREPQLSMAPVQLNQLIDQVTELTRARWQDMPQESGIPMRLETALESELPEVLGVESEIRDALTNLILNAADAMPQGGILSLRTRAITTGPVGSVHVEVSDTGTGMSEETRRRCLEPFFTTKGERGTGLGLAMVYGMAQRHRAAIEIESEPGKGTTVRLAFPIRIGTKATPSRHIAAGSTPGLRVLVVDDDALLVRSLRDALEAEGHLVTAAGGGQAGIDAFLGAQNSQEPFGVVITDLGMPDVDGRKVAASVKAAAPSTPVILLTGWGQRMAAERDIPPFVDHLLSKPPRLHELRALLAGIARSPANGIENEG